MGGMAPEAVVATTLVVATDVKALCEKETAVEERIRTSL